MRGDHGRSRETARRPPPRGLRIEVVSNPDDPDTVLYESGALLPGPHAILAGPTFEECPASGGGGSTTLRVECSVSLIGFRSASRSARPPLLPALLSPPGRPPPG